MESTVTRSRPIFSALSLLLAVLWLFSLTSPRSGGEVEERPAPAFAASDHPAIPFVARSRPFDAPKAAPRTGLEPRLVGDIPELHCLASDRARPGATLLTPPSRRSSACSARGPPVRA